MATGAALAVGITACAASGRTMTAPAPGATAPPRATSSTAAVTTPALPFTLTSPNFAPGGRLPAEATCPEGISPALNWANVPAGTAELVLVLRDDAGDEPVRWLVTGIPPHSGGLPAGSEPPGAVTRPNSAGRAAYDAPCPASGSHTYDFEILALGVPSSLPTDLPAEEALSRLDALAGTKRAGLSATATARPGSTAAANTNPAGTTPGTPTAAPTGTGG